MTLRKLLIIFLALSVAVIVACGGSSSAKQNTIVTTGANVAPLTVNAGPAATTNNGGYVNGAFTSVQVCVPGTSTCQTISGILVDTGSSGLRILSSALNISLPQQTGSGGDPIAECLPFVSAFTWGSVETADIQVASETASAVPIQVIGTSNFSIPTSCSDLGNAADDLGSLGANGLLGVGLALQDCGQGCTVAGPSNFGLYYACPTSTSCAVTTEPLTAQVANPVALFPTDNNGVIIELPSASGSEASLSGSLIFGIGTESNNALGSATVYTVDEFGTITTQFDGQSYSGSFLDSGSNGFYFLEDGASGVPPVCSDNGDFYCPSSVDNLSATNVGADGTSGAKFNFSVANADTLFNTGGNDAVFSQLGGPFGALNFDWGLPFFYGRNVFTAIETKSTPGGTGPFFAY
jgi:hypothetical protein